MSRAHEIDRWFAEEILPHEPVLRAWLHGHFPSRTDIDDLVQESYVRLLRAWDRQGIRNGRNFLFATAHNAAIDLVRHEQTILFEPIEESAGLSVLDVEADVVRTVGTKEELEILHAAMESLPRRCRRVFTLRKLHALSHQEIATLLGISPRTVEAQIDKAMRRCAAFLRANGLP